MKHELKRSGVGQAGLVAGRAGLLAAAAAGVLFAGGAPVASADVGGLVQKAVPEGCVSDDGSGGVCGDGTALDGPWAVTVSPGKACAGSTLLAAAQAKRRFKLVPKRSARGKRVKLTFKATSPVAENGRATAILRVKR